MEDRKTCTIDGCDGPHMSRGWCSKHYYRWKRNGDPLVTTRQPPMDVAAGAKHCPRCGKSKPVRLFGQRREGGLKGYCKACERSYQEQYAKSADGREAHRRARSRWNRDNHEYFLMYRYGITTERYEEMLAAQGGRCAICRTDNPGNRNKVFPVDHCHNGGGVRGLLCVHCNMGIGQLGDDPARLRAAADYIERNR